MNLSIKAEKAFVLWLQQQLPGETILPGRNSGTIAEQCVIASCRPDMEAESRLGNSWVELEVTVKTSSAKEESDDSSTAQIDSHLALCASVFGNLRTTTLAADVSAMVADFTILIVASPGAASEIPDHYWEDSFTARLLCANADVT